MNYLISIECAISKNMLKNLPRTNQYYLTNHSSISLTKHSQQIHEAIQQKNITWVPNYTPLLNNFSNKQLNLIIGTPHQHLHHGIIHAGGRFITLQELCAIFPTKVPLSYRGQQNSHTKAKVENRLKMKLDDEPHIDHVLITNHISMWDEALQTIVDLNQGNTDFVVEYDRHQAEDQHGYTLNMEDFVSAMQTCYRTIHNQSIDGFTNYNSHNLQLQWFLNHIIPPQHQHSLTVDSSLIQEAVPFPLL